MTEWDGRPENPERDGWHWVRTVCGGEPAPMEWTSLRTVDNVRVWLTRDGYTSPQEAAEQWVYLGPCLTPAEVEARVAAARREAEMWRQQCAKDQEVAQLMGARILSLEADLAAARDAGRIRALLTEGGR